MIPKEQREGKTLTEIYGDTESALERTSVALNEIANRADTRRTLQQSHFRPASHELHISALDVSGNGGSSKHSTEHSRGVIESQIHYLPESVLMTSDQSGIFKNQRARKMDLWKPVSTDMPLGFEHMDIPLSSTMDKESSEIKRPFSQLSVATNEMFSDMSLDSTLRNKSVSFQEERDRLEYDSLASTSLSVAFSGEGLVSRGLDIDVRALL